MSFAPGWILRPDQLEVKHFKQKQSKRNRRKKQLKVLSVLLLIVLAVLAFTVYRDYKARPGFLEKIWIEERGADYITVAWERARNVNKYVLMYDGNTIEVSGKKKGVKIHGLAEDTEYEFSVRADSKKRKGFETLTEKARTKKSQHITGEAGHMKFMNRPVDLKQTAETPVKYLPGDGYTVTEDNKIVFTKPGTITVTAATDENDEYATATKEISVEVMDTVSVEAEGASPHVFYKLNKKNCECVKRVRGEKEASIPQSLAYSDGKYIIAYISKTTQRVITFGNNLEEVYVPTLDLGHANGMTAANGICYIVKGGNNADCITFDPKKNTFSSFKLAQFASGIAYDRAKDMFYTSQRNGMTAYDNKFNLVRKVGRVSRKTKYYYQDCGAYGGIMIHCVSGENYRGTNYLDFYDMINGKYMGTIECDLSEIESMIVDDEGYIELLSNVKDKQDLIWKTPINMKDLCD